MAIFQKRISHIYAPKALSNSVLIDMPGIGDVRGLEIEIGAAVCRQHIMNELEKIRCIIFACTYNSLISTVPTDFYDVAIKIGNIIKFNEEANVIFAVTQTEKIPEKIDVVAIQKRLKNIQRAYEAQIQSDRSKAILATIRTILFKPYSRIHITNVTSSISRQWFVKEINSLAPVPGEKFDFAYGDPTLNQFIAFIKEVMIRQFNIHKLNIKNNKDTFLNVNRFIREVTRISRVGSMNSFPFQVLETLPTSITDDIVNSYIYLIPKQQGKEITLYYVRAVNSLEVIRINDAIKFKDQLKQLFGVELIEAQNKTIMLSKENVAQLITANSNTKHTPIGSEQRLSDIIGLLENAPMYAKDINRNIRNTCIIIMSLLVCLEGVKFIPQIPQRYRNNIPTMYTIWGLKGWGFASGGSIAITTIGSRLIEFLAEKIKKGATHFEIVTGLKSLLASMKANETNIKQYINESVNSLEKSTSILRNDFEKSFLDLEVARDCYKKIAAVLNSLALKDDEVIHFVNDVNSLEQFLDEIRPVINSKIGVDQNNTSQLFIRAKL